MINSIIKFSRVPRALIVRRAASSVTSGHDDVQRRIDHLKNFDPNNYSIPLRPVTMDDGMEPYGSYKVAYAAEKRLGNFCIIRGFLALSASLAIFYYAGCLDGVIMPNLDNIMEETESTTADDLEDRITV